MNIDKMYKSLASRHARLVERNKHLEDWIRRNGNHYDICTKNILFDVCENCQCKNKIK